MLSVRAILRSQLDELEALAEFTEGTIRVLFSTQKESERVVAMMNGRLFDGVLSPRNSKSGHRRIQKQRGWCVEFEFPGDAGKRIQARLGMSDRYSSTLPGCCFPCPCSSCVPFHLFLCLLVLTRRVAWRSGWTPRLTAKPSTSRASQRPRQPPRRRRRPRLPCRCRPKRATCCSIRFLPTSAVLIRTKHRQDDM